MNTGTSLRESALHCTIQRIMDIDCSLIRSRLYDRHSPTLSRRARMRWLTISMTLLPFCLICFPVGLFLIETIAWPDNNRYTRLASSNDHIRSECAKFKRSYGCNGGETLDERHGFAVFIDDHKFILCMLVAILFGLMPLYGEWTARTSCPGT